MSFPTKNKEGTPVYGALSPVPTTTSNVVINWDNIHEGRRHNFEKRKNDGKDVGPYDHASIMHYPRDAFSTNGSPTIVTTKPIGQRARLSVGDTNAVAEAYGPK